MNFSQRLLRISAGSQSALAFLAISWMAVFSHGQVSNDVVVARIYDPFFKQSSRIGDFRPINISIGLAQPGAVSAKDWSFYAVHRIGPAFYYATYRDQISWQRFVLAKGDSSVDLEFVVHSGGNNFQSVMDEFFLETDGDLNYSGAANRDFGYQMTSQGAAGGSEEMPKFLFVFSDAPLENFFKREIQVDLSQRRRSPTFELLVRPPFQVELPADSDPSSLPNVRELSQVFNAALSVPTNFTRQRGLVNSARDLEIRELFASSSSLYHIAPEYFPTTWKALVGFDFVVIRYEDLMNLRQREDLQQVQALQKWVAAGGRLILTDCGGEARIARNAFAALFEPTLGPDQTLWQADWKALAQSLDIATVEKLFEVDPNDFYKKRSFGDRVAQMSYPMTDWDMESPLPENGVCFDHNLGRVLVWPGKAADLTSIEWKKILVASYTRGAHAKLETTIGLGHLNKLWMYDFKLPGLGEPPQFLFLCLICAFAVLVGPLAYWWLYHHRRLSYLLAIVPILSGMVTVGLLLYAVLMSGLEFRAQRFSFTRLDQRSRTAVTLTEQAVFSGVNPRSYDCNKDQYLFVPDYLGRGRLKVQTSESGHEFSSPEIRARTMHQVAAVDIQSTDRRLEVVRRQQNGAEVIQVKNLLGAPVTAGYVRWAEQLYEFGPLEPEAQVEAKPVNSGDLQPILKLAQGMRPALQASRTLNSYQLNGNVDSPVDSWGLCQAMTRPPFLVQERIRSGEFYCLMDDFQGAFELKPQTQYHSQLHLIHGSW